MASDEQSYYKILGTTAKISQRRIKEKYVAAVKEHPPETDPEQFEKIREAYETLKDPVKRKQYDIKRKYGDKIEKMLEKAEKYEFQNDHRKAEQVYQDILQIEPDNFSALIGLTFSSIEIDNLDTAYQMLEKSLASPVITEDETLSPAMIYGSFGNKLINNKHWDETIEFLENGIRRFSDGVHYLTEALAVAYFLTGDAKRAVETAESGVPTIEDETIEDLPQFMAWIFIIMQSESWSQLSKVQSRFRKFLKNLQEDEDREEAFLELITEYEVLYDRHKYRQAEVFLDFAKVVKPADEDINDELKEIKKLARMEKDFQRLLKDQSMFPLIMYYTAQWYFDDKSHLLIQEMDEHFTNDVISGFEEETEYFAAGILKLRKSYPALYNHFKSEWDEVYKDLTKDFNREMKRGLKKLM